MSFQQTTPSTEVPSSLAPPAYSTFPAQQEAASLQLSSPRIRYGDSGGAIIEFRLPIESLERQLRGDCDGACNCKGCKKPRKNDTNKKARQNEKKGHEPEAEIAIGSGFIFALVACLFYCRYFGGWVVPLFFLLWSAPTILYAAIMCFKGLDPLPATERVKGGAKSEYDHGLDLEKGRSPHKTALKPSTSETRCCVASVAVICTIPAFIAIFYGSVYLSTGEFPHIG